MALTAEQRAQLARKLERILETQDALADAGASAIERAYKDALGAAVARLKRLVRGLPVDQAGRLVPDLRAASSVSPSLLSENEPWRLVWVEWAGRLSDLLKLQADYGEAVGGGAGALWLGADRSALEALAGLWPGAPGEAGSGLAGRYYTMSLDQRQRLAQLTTRHILGRLPARTFEAMIDEELERQGARARQLIHDETLGFARAAHERKAAQLNLEFFRYSGPQDLVTRPFCKRLAGAVLSRDEVDSLDNGQTGPGSAMLACGGFNCRHRWAAVSPLFYDDDEWASLRARADQATKTEE